MVKSYRPRLNTNEVVTLLYLIRDKRQVLRYQYENASPEKQWMVPFWRKEHKRLLPLLRKFERLDPLNHGYNERWKHKRISKEEGRQRMVEGITRLREEIQLKNIKTEMENK